MSDDMCATESAERGTNRSRRIIRVAILLGAMGALSAPVLAGLSRVTVAQSTATATASSGSSALPPFQEALLADGEVTFADYSRSVEASINCVKERVPTVEVVGPKPSDSGQFLEWSFRSSGSADGGGSDAMDSVPNVIRSCTLEYLSEVEESYRRQHGPSEDQQRAAATAFGKCLEDAGVPTEAVPSPDELATSENPEVRACFEQLLRE